MDRADIRLFDSTGFLFSADSWNPSAVRGADKVGQRFVYFLMTPVGSVPGRPDDGTRFLDSVRTFRSEFDLFTAFAAAEPSAAASVRDAEDANDLPAEKYGWSRLAGVQMDGDSVTLLLSVAAADGSMTTEPVSITFTP